MRKVLTHIVLGFGLMLSPLTQADAPAWEVTLYKIPQCSCCEEHAAYLRRNGFTVTVKITHEHPAMSRAAGIPDEFHGFHLSNIDDYAISGHVPANIINRLLSERPDIKELRCRACPRARRE